MLTDHDLARWRLRSQRLVTPHAGSSAEVVTALLAVQAENPAQSAWAVASRTSAPDEDDLASLLGDGRVLRTHVLRPTWHYVTAEDLAWLVELTAPRVLKTIDQGLKGAEGYDDAALDRLGAVVLDALAGTDLTRPEVDVALREHGHELTGHALMLLLARLELLRLVCSGRPADATHTYAVLAERVPSARRLGREEALAELAFRYLTGHGPATERDLAYWATLTLTDVRTGIRAVSGRLASFEHDGRTYWHAPGEEPPTAGDPRAHLLQILDETYRGYQDSRWVLDADGVVPRARESAIGMALVDAQMVAAMKRTVGDGRVTFELRPYRGPTTQDRAAIDEAAGRYAAFLGREPETRWS